MNRVLDSQPSGPKFKSAATSGVSLGKALYPHYPIPLRALKAISPMVAFRPIRFQEHIALSTVSGRGIQKHDRRRVFQTMYRKSTSIRHFEQCNQSLSNLICQNCDGSIKILLDVGNQQHAV